MLKRRLPPAALRTGPATLTISKRIGSQIAAEAITRCKSLDRDLAKADDPVALVEEAHLDADTLRDIAGQIEAQAHQFKGAADLLDGRETDQTGSLIDLAATTAASFETLHAIDADLELGQLTDCSKALREASAALFADHNTIQSRRVKHDIGLKRLTLRCLTLDHVSAHDVQSYELPDDFVLPERLSANEWAAGGFGDTPGVQFARDVAGAAKRYFNEEREAGARLKSSNKAVKRREMVSYIADIWSAANG
ncbi:hypothetical protein [Falsiruegeria litorea]|uniref:hypothetical protein n=1 Tax=Falsiruegeria litorea TaxID=1280831 RepID=UPI001BFE3535|nr:hypothetical protein [Falsiruegeria litorea]MBT8169667.1 hypothetical protein [Falsiruegeria litorea]